MIVLQIPSAAGVFSIKNKLSQTEAFAALGRLRYHTSPTEEILHGGNCLALILSIAGYDGDKIAQGDGANL